MFSHPQTQPEVFMQSKIHQSAQKLADWVPYDHPIQPILPGLVGRLRSSPRAPFVPTFQHIQAHLDTTKRAPGLCWPGFKASCRVCLASTSLTSYPGPFWLFLRRRQIYTDHCWDTAYRLFFGRSQYFLDNTWDGLAIFAD